MNVGVIFGIIVLAIAGYGGYLFLSSPAAQDLIDAPNSLEVSEEQKEEMKEQEEEAAGGEEEVMEHEESETMDEGSAEEVVEEAGAEEESEVTEEEVSQEEPAAQNTITYTDDGYSPKTITIKKGESVTFVNSSTRKTWPASAIHPTHSLYPGKTPEDCLGSAFDACRGLEVGESWSFTFNEVGSWNYHDHIRASKTGTVIVQ